MYNPDDPAISISIDDVPPKTKRLSDVISPIVTEILHLYEKKEFARTDATDKALSVEDLGVIKNEHLHAIEMDYEAKKSLQVIEQEIFFAKNKLFEQLPESLAEYLHTNRKSQYEAFTDEGGKRYFLSAVGDYTLNRTYKVVVHTDPLKL